MRKPIIITATEASRSFSELLHRIAYGGESFIIKKGSREMARIGPVPTDEPEVAHKKASQTKKSAPKLPEITIPDGTSAEEAEYLRAIMLAQAEKTEPESA